MKRWRKRLVRVFAVVLVGGVATLAGSWWAASSLIAPSNHAVPAALDDLAPATVQIPSASGTTLRGWWLPGKPQAGAVLLLHGVRADRASMAGRARFLHAAGYAVLAIDMQAHGESPGEKITLGLLESRDARASVAFLREHAPGERVGVIGVSMGGAAVVLADPPMQVDAIVLEQVYPTIEDAIGDRLRIKFGPGGQWLSPLLLWQLPWRLPAGAAALRPIEHIGAIHVPKLLIAGEDDSHTRIEEALALFDAAGEPKEWWSVSHATHQDLHALLGTEYETRIDAFFSHWLRPAPQATANSIPSRATATIESISSGVTQ